MSENDVEIKRTINECRGPITLKGDPNSVLNKRFSGIVNQGRKRHYYYNELMLNDTLRKDTARYHDYLINMLKLGTSDARLLNVAIILLPLPVDNSPEALKLESSRLKAIAEISSFLPDFPKFVKRYKGEDPAIYWPFSLNANIPRTPAADILNDKMRAAKARNDLKEALKQAQAILDIQPFHYNTLYNAGLFCLRLDGYGVKPGGDYLLQAWILNQKDADLNFLLARLYSVKKEGQKALYFLESAAKNGYKSQTPLKDNPNFNHIKADDRFIHLGKQIDVE
ncbi:MAG: hypothetical protein GY940_29330 [bacterium]|nr:hypothetical protein [bacterium]